VSTSIFQSRWFWPVAGIGLSLLLMKIFPGNFFLLLPLLGLFSFGGRKSEPARAPQTPINRDRQPGFARATDVQNENTGLISTLVERYNAHDHEGVAELFAPDCKEYSHGGDLLREGPRSIADNYRKLFAEFPQNRASVVHRSAFGDKVIDHERVMRSPSHDAFEVIVIYTIKDGAIVRTDYVK
jgi:hypothetical protein